MKVKKFKFNYILRLHTLKSKVYRNLAKKLDSKLLTSIHLTQTVINIKKALNIIFRYHLSEKRILFVGVPRELELKINRFTHHAAFPATFNFQSFISINRKNNFSSTFSKNLLSSKFSNRPDLLVFFSISSKEEFFLKKFFFMTPSISVEPNYVNEHLSLIKSLYKVQQTEVFSSLSSNGNLFFIGLNFIFKMNKKNTSNYKFLKKLTSSKYKKRN